MGEDLPDDAGSATVARGGDRRRGVAILGSGVDRVSAQLGVRPTSSAASFGSRSSSPWAQRGSKLTFCPST